MNEDGSIQQYSRKELYNNYMKDSLMKYMKYSITKCQIDKLNVSRKHQSMRDIFMNKYGRKYITNYGGCKRITPEYYTLKKDIYDKYLK